GEGDLTLCVDEGEVASHLGGEVESVSQPLVVLVHRSRGIEVDTAWEVLQAQRDLAVTAGLDHVNGRSRRPRSQREVLRPGVSDQSPRDRKGVPVEAEHRRGGGWIEDHEGPERDPTILKEASPEIDEERKA